MLYCRFVTALTDMSATGLWLYSIFEFQRGVGNLVGGSVSSIFVGDVFIGGEVRKPHSLCWHRIFNQLSLWLELLVFQRSSL